MIPKVEIETCKADLFRDILGVNDMHYINLLD